MITDRLLIYLTWLILLVSAIGRLFGQYFEIHIELRDAAESDEPHEVDK